MSQRVAGRVLRSSQSSTPTPTPTSSQPSSSGAAEAEAAAAASAAAAAAREAAIKAAEEAARAQEAARAAREAATANRVSGSKDNQGTLDGAANAAVATAQKASSAAVQAQNRALQAEWTSNTAATAAGQPPPYPQLTSEKDAFEVASLPLNDQQALLGSPALTSSSQALSGDAMRLVIAAQAGGVQGASALADLLSRSPDPDYQRDLIEQAGPALDLIAQKIATTQADPTGEGQKALDVLFQATQTASPESATVIATRLAPAFQAADSAVLPPALETALQGMQTSGKGSRLANALSSALASNNQPLLAGRVSDLSSATLSAASTDLQDAKAKVDALNGQIQGTVQDLAAAGYSQQQLAQVMASFRAEHPEYQAYADASAHAAALVEDAANVVRTDISSLNPASSQARLWESARALLKALPALADSPAGSSLFADAAAQSVSGAPTFLDVLPTVANATPDPNGYLDAISAAVVDGVGMRATELQLQGNSTGAKNALSALGAQTAIFRVDSNTLAGAIKALSTYDARGEAGLKAFAQGLGTNLRNIGLGGESAQKLAVRLGGLGTTLGLIGTVGGVGGWAEATDAQKLTTITLGLGTGLQGAKYGSDLILKSQLASAQGIAKSSAVVSKLGARAGPLLTALGSGISAADAFSKGNPDEGIADLAVASGTLIAFSAPGPGTVVGTGLIVLGTGYKIGKAVFGPEGDLALEGDVAKALVALGVPADKAEQLKKLDDGRHFVGQFIGAEASRLGISSQDYLKHLVSLSNEDLAKVVEVARQISVDEQGKLIVEAPPKYPNAPESIPLNPDERNSQLDLTEVHTVAHAHDYLASLGLLPGTTTPQAPATSTTAIPSAGTTTSTAPTPTAVPTG